MLPIMFTEFGVDYLQDNQVDRLLGMWSDIVSEQGVLSLGGCIMEVYMSIAAYRISRYAALLMLSSLSLAFVPSQWSDEWWKGNVPDFHNPNCPNLQPNEHSRCGIIESDSNTYIHEEWLGLFALDNSSINTKVRNATCSFVCLVCVPRSLFVCLYSIASNPAIATTTSPSSGTPMPTLIARTSFAPVSRISTGLSSACASPLVPCASFLPRIS